MDKATLFARVQAAYQHYDIGDRILGNPRFKASERDAIVSEALNGGISVDELVAAHDLAREFGPSEFGDAFSTVELAMRSKASKATRFAADAVNAAKEAGRRAGRAADDLINP